MSEALADKFAKELHQACDILIEKEKYRSTILLEMMEQLGAVGAAKQLVDKNCQVQSGFYNLINMGYRELTTEAIMLKDEYRVLFTQDELDVAQFRLDNYKELYKSLKM